MKIKNGVIATAELILIFPAVLFFTALIVRSLQPLQYEPAHTAQRVVDWYAARPHLGLWELLIGLPLLVLVTGGAMLLRRWSHEPELQQAARLISGTVRAHLPTILVAAATLTSGGILAAVGLHILTD